MEYFPNLVFTKFSVLKDLSGLAIILPSFSRKNIYINKTKCTTSHAVYIVQHVFYLILQILTVF